MEESLIRGKNLYLNINTSLKKEDIAMLSPLQLAYIGDGVYELLVRTYLINRGDSVNQLHKKATKFVKAKAQTEYFHKIEDRLTDEEIRVVKRGRNTKSNVPKNASVSDYKYATGFEALIGYLYLRGKDNRIIEIFNMIIEE